MANNNKDTRKRVKLNTEETPSLTNINYDNAEASTSSEGRTEDKEHMGNATVANRKRKSNKSKRCIECKKEMKAEKRKRIDNTTSTNSIFKSVDTNKSASEDDPIISTFIDLVGDRLERNTDRIAVNQIAAYLNMFLVKNPEK